MLDSTSPAPQVFGPLVPVSSKKGAQKKKSSKKEKPLQAEGKSGRPKLKIEIQNERARKSPEVLFDSDAEIAQLEDKVQGAVGGRRVDQKSKGLGVTVKDLRKMPQVVNEAENALENLGLLPEVESSEEEEDCQPAGKGKP